MVTITITVRRQPLNRSVNTPNSRYPNYVFLEFESRLSPQGLGDLPLPEFMIILIWLNFEVFQCGFNNLVTDLLQLEIIHKWASEMPSFRELSSNDQKALLRSSAPELLVFSICSFSVQNNCGNRIICRTLIVIRVSEIKVIPYRWSFALFLFAQFDQLSQK